MARNKLSTRRQYIRRKYKLGRPPVFKQQPKGTLVYSNPNAVPVEKIKPVRWNFSNVEWLRKQDQLTKGGIGLIWLSKLKIRGDPKPRTVILKEILPHPQYWLFRQTSYAEVIWRLDHSQAAHPKMAYFKQDKKSYIVSEPFLSRSPKTHSKFAGTGSQFFRALEFENSKQTEIFEEAIRQTAFLAKVRLAVTEDSAGKMDVFHGFQLRNGKTRVFVQDIDLLTALEDSNHAWRVSVDSILTSLRSSSRLSDEKLAQAIQIIKKIGNEQDLSLE